MDVATGTTERRISVNGADLFVWEIGTGTPVVLVQPGLVSSAVYRGLAQGLATRYRVVAFDSRGHGRSTNPGGDLTYQLIADDTAALIDALDLERPFVGGWSDGGEVALQVDLRHPGRVRGVIAGGTSLEMGGGASERVRREQRAFFHADANAVVDIDAFAAEWEGSLLPLLRESHPYGEEHWQRVVRATAKMWLTYGGMVAEDPDGITAPVLVAAGDRDEFVSVEDVVRLHRWLRDAELAILPGSDHMGRIFAPALLVSVLLDFLDRHTTTT